MSSALLVEIYVNSIMIFEFFLRARSEKSFHLEKRERNTKSAHDVEKKSATRCRLRFTFPHEALMRIFIHSRRFHVRLFLTRDVLKAFEGRTKETEKKAQRFFTGASFPLKD